MIMPVVHEYSDVNSDGVFWKPKLKYNRPKPVALKWSVFCAILHNLLTLVSCCSITLYKATM